MARYNHFAKCPYRQIRFYDLKIGDSFRSALFNGKRFRGYILCTKTGFLEYIEQKSKVVHTLFDNSAMVYEEKIQS